MTAGTRGALSAVEAAVIEDELRHALVREARAKVDAARTEYGRVLHARRRLEQRSAPEVEIIAADRLVYAARIELTRARRQLLRSI